MKTLGRSHFLKSSLFIVGMVWAASSLHAVPEKEIQGREAADAWLVLVDTGKYAESWKDCAPLFREAIPEKQWMELIAKVRAPLGKVESRKLKSLFFTESLPDAPPGQFVVVQYETKFAGREDIALETITPMFVKADNAWRVSGYYIK